MNAAMQPVEKRLHQLDVLRGFALLGILLVNFQWFTRPMQAIVMGAESGLGGADLWVDLLIKSLAEGKFYALFSMLFGIGFALMAQRAEQSQAPFWGVYLRRILVLGLFGLAHALLIWPGDILLVYALTALLMIVLFRKTPLSRLWKWALVFIITPVAIMGALTALISLAMMVPEAAEEISKGMVQREQQMVSIVAAADQIYRSGSYLDVIGVRAQELRFALGNFLFWVVPVLGYFMLGRWLMGSKVILDPSAHHGWLSGARRWGLLLGLPLSLVGAWLIHPLNLTMPTPTLFFAMLLTMAGALLLALGYVGTVVLAADRLRWLAAVGQMALSNYLLQSLVWTSIFYGYGLGLWGSVDRVWHLPLALGFFALQILLSHWWMARFRFGPAEWLWRTLTYAKRQPMRR